jgi:23S rRNA (adenine2503-C2)-methyltransferase
MTLAADTLAAPALAAAPILPELATAKPSLAGATRAELAQALAAVGVPPRDLRMRVTQLWHWIYHHGVRDFSAMLNVSKHLRAALAEAYTLERPEIVTEQLSTDGTRKWLIRMPPTDARDRGAEIECVYIPESDRGTLCVSSVGRRSA